PKAPSRQAAFDFPITPADPCRRQTPGVPNKTGVKRSRLRPRYRRDDSCVERQPLASEECWPDEERSNSFGAEWTGGARKTKNLDRCAERSANRKAEGDGPHTCGLGSRCSVTGSSRLANVQIHRYRTEMVTRNQ